MKFNLNINNSKFNELIIEFNETLLTNNLLEESIKLFFNEVIKQDKKYFSLILFEYELYDYRTLSKGKIITKDSLEQYIDFNLAMFNFRSSDYRSLTSQKIIFKFFVIPSNIEHKYLEKWEEIKPLKHIKLYKFGKINLPMNNLYQTWGKLLSPKIIISKNRIYHINPNNIEIYENGEKILTFKDEISNNEKYDFLRIIDNCKYYIKDNSIVLTTKELPTSYLQTLKSKISDGKIITFDIETLLVNNVHKPYLYSMYDGFKSYSWFTESPKQLFDKLLTWKYRNYNVYAHNLSRFDVVFIFKYLSTLKNKGFNIKLLIREQNIISIIINRNNNISITIKDSYLILPSSLSKLSKQFVIDNPKLIEPVFTGDSNSPYFMSDLSHYNKEIIKIDDLDLWKEQIQKYCEVDCISLHQVLIKFRELIINKFNIDILKYPTIPSLAFAIFRMHYLKENTIPITTGKVFDFIKQSFTGGRTDMYKPNGLNKDIYVYDVNSLYPYVMSEFKYPIGQIIQFEGDPTILDNKYWIGDVNVTSKNDMFIPPIQLHHNITNKSGGIRTISPNGSFNCKLNSVEYDSYKEFYNFNSGYLWEKDYVFKNFIKFLYTLRTQYPKSDPMNYISKLLMNSLYGRFAMKNIRNIFEFLDKSEFFKLLENDQIEIKNYIDLNDSLFVNYINNSQLDKESKSSISIASAVTAYARSYMFNIIEDNIDNIYYSDTDSLYLDRPLNKHLISSNELGKFKLEYVFKDSVYLGPKMYAGITNDNDYICKIKGFKNTVPFDDIKSLLIKDNKLNLNHIKWFRSLVNGNITLKDQIYELQKTENKREIIYNNNLAISTKPYSISNHKQNLFNHSYFD
uniref:DNA polymerase n=1 Tax=Taiwanofungus camphoratus TaxID=2696576 RepID=A0A4D6SSS2_TAICA|nr:DNA polymerase [Taiwanofungus camphoratus]QCG70007.1 DNA polymerase [Taiwanofungus camphoratus]